ncbi:hypothetical protein PSH85_25145 [Pseudomonas simiae]|uniref:hypothetical protein n=1 Tax=Pseudomonas simiae TaxID=321846 RepID=UPI002734F88B|nr:hypothetical protein [Pseudomonas simiae]WLI23547.1 hypothetical protein PSH85_25145 [Pseudomonas simiae]
MNDMLLELSTGVPEVFTSIDGYRCNFADGRWTLNRNITVNIGLARALMSSESYEGAVSYFKILCRKCVGRTYAKFV